MNTNMKHIVKLFQSKEIKPTVQRLRIFEYLSKEVNHPAVETIYENILKEIPTISKTTVYNTLNLFLEKRLISAVIITGTEIRYDIEVQPHHHFLCKKCGKIINLDVHCPISDGKVNIVQGNLIEEVHGYFKGICKDCLKYQKTRKELI
jgi:Fur family peroxide stress response transcriptional regulator